MMLLGGLVRLTGGAELTGYGDFHFTFVWVNEKNLKNPEPNGIW